VRYEIILVVIIVILRIGIYGLPNYGVLYRSTLVLLIVAVFGLVIRSRLLDWPWEKKIYVFFVTSLILAPVLLYGILSVKYFMPEVVFRYKMWERLDSSLGTKRAIALSDYVRGMMPSLAACNPFLKDAVVSSTQKSQFIARWSDWAQLRHQIHVQAIEFQEIEGNTLEPCACSYSFEIGSGKISVDASPQCENNFKFESTARGRLLEKFVTITDWNRIAKIFRILRYWEKSPDLGVIENLYVVDGDGIYCHCLSLQSIVEGVCKSPEQFSLFELSEPRRFYVGSSPKRKRDEDKNSISFIPRLCAFLGTLQVVISIFLAASKLSRVEVIVGLLIGLALASVVFIDGLTSHFPLKLFVHCVLATILSDDCRYGFYRWLKRKGCFLAFCDDFNPVLHRASDETELITLHNCTPGNSFTTMVDQLDWDKINIGFCQSYTWHSHATGFESPIVVPTTSTPVSRSIQDFESHQQGRRYFQLTWRESTNQSRTLTARSELCNPNDIEATARENILWHTQLRLDGDDLQHLYWREPSYLLFIYLMLLWKGRKFGVISDFRHFWYANYYHVFSTYELARHIEENEKNDSNMLKSSYHILIEKPKHTDMVAGYIHCKDVSFVFYFASPTLDFIIPAKSKKTLYLLPTPEFLCCWNSYG
jgi:hypothetical protein